ncbi:Uncharacterised protein [Sphingobacterium multivorum]|nr:Uncharacterised protein [Sphingobacterium multivorum]
MVKIPILISINPYFGCGKLKRRAYALGQSNFELSKLVLSLFSN